MKPSYYRARTKAIEELLNEAHILSQEAKTEQEKKTFDRTIVQLRNGFVADKDSIKSSIQYKLKEELLSDEPLSFQEITSYSTWFEMHPEKIAGVEYPGTGVMFPVLMKGGKEDVKRVLGQMHHQMHDEKSDSIEELELEALAIKIELELLSFSPLSGIFNKPKKTIILR